MKLLAETARLRKSAKEVKKSEAHTCSSHGIALHGGGDSGHG
jgi:hypothetical protein